MVRVSFSEALKFGMVVKSKLMIRIEPIDDLRSLALSGSPIMCIDPLACGAARDRLAPSAESASKRELEQSLQPVRSTPLAAPHLGR